MNNPDKAVANFEKGMNCAQSVISVYGPQYGLDPDLCVRIASAFGGGIGHTQGICGAVTGAIMVIGLKHGKGTAERDRRDHINALARQFIEEFKKRNGGVMCRRLLDFDISTDEGLFEARQRGLFVLCAGFIRTAAEILERML